MFVAAPFCVWTSYRALIGGGPVAGTEGSSCSGLINAPEQYRRGTGYDCTESEERACGQSAPKEYSRKGSCVLASRRGAWCDPTTSKRSLQVAFAVADSKRSCRNDFRSVVVVTLSCSPDTSLLFLVSGSPVSTHFVQCIDSDRVPTGRRIQRSVVELVCWLAVSRGLRPILAPMCLSCPRRLLRTSPSASR